MSASITDIKEKSSQKQQEKRSVGFGGGVKMKNFTMMIRQLATLVKARIPLDEARSNPMDRKGLTRF